MENILEQIQFINISKENKDDLLFWVKSGTTPAKYQLDTLSVKALTINEGFYYQIQRHNLKICFIKRNSLLFMIGGDEKIQTQLLEAIIDESIIKFFDYYGDIIKQYSGDFPDAFNGFSLIIKEIIDNIKSKITYLKVSCKACDNSHLVCVKNSLIENSKDFPVSIVYYHSGHGLLIYIDASFKVRGAEIVKITE